jgi:hypothetical protein
MKFQYGDRVHVTRGKGADGTVAFAGPGYCRVHLDGTSTQQTYPFDNQDLVLVQTVAEANEAWKGGRKNYND